MVKSSKPCRKLLMIRDRQPSLMNWIRTPPRKISISRTLLDLTNRPLFHLAILSTKVTFLILNSQRTPQTRSQTLSRKTNLKTATVMTNLRKMRTPWVFSSNRASWSSSLTAMSKSCNARRQSSRSCSSRPTKVMWGTLRRVRRDFDSWVGSNRAMVSSKSRIWSSWLTVSLKPTLSNSWTRSLNSIRRNKRAPACLWPRGSLFAPTSRSKLSETTQFPRGHLASCSCH